MLKLKYTRESLKKDNFQIYSYMRRNFKFISSFIPSFLYLTIQLALSSSIWNTLKSYIEEGHD